TQAGGVPPKANGGFVAALEDVRAVYARPYAPKRPQVCLDEAGKQLIGAGRPPLSLRPGQPRRADYADQRHGTANLFLVFEPLAGRRRGEGTARRANQDFARIIRRFVDEWYSGPRRWSQCRTTSPRTPPRPCARRSRQRRRGGGWRSWSGTPRPSPARGCTWPRWR